MVDLLECKVVFGEGIVVGVVLEVEVVDFGLIIRFKWVGKGRIIRCDIFNLIYVWFICRYC